MKYLYIPTTTLNFNNILSTGSISPAAIYASRRFGYKQFECVESNPFKNVLLLYDRCPVFTIDDAERDSHPLVLRVRADLCPSNISKLCWKIDRVSTYTCPQTIYFDSSSVVLYFSTLDARKSAIVKAEPSLTTKLVKLYDYDQCFQLYSDDNLDTFQWSKKFVDRISDGPKDAVDKCYEKDIRINRLKGFACGYILGAYRSIDPKMAVMQSKARELRNENSAMMSDPSISFSDAKHKEIERAWTTLEQCYAEAGIGTRRFNPCPEGSDSIEISEYVVRILDHQQSDIKSIESLVKLINSYCLKSDFFGELGENRKKVMQGGGMAIRELIGDKWEGSDYKKYINALGNNFSSGKEFYFKDTKSLALQSFAAFVLKGDDLEKLEIFLIEQEIGDFRLAFALWGAMFGFSKIPKTTFNLPFAHGDESYAKEIHRYVHNIVHHIPLKDIEPPPSLTKQLPSVSRPESKPIEPHMTILDQLIRERPGFMHWETKLRELFKASGGHIRKFITLLNKTKIDELGGKQKGISKEAVKKYVRDEHEPYSQASLGQGTLTLGQQQSDVFWSDERAWDVISEVVSQGVKNRVKENLEWFQKEWQDPKSKYYGWQNEGRKTPIKNKMLEQRTNAEAIHYFCRILSREALQEQEIEKIKCVLEDRYH